MNQRLSENDHLKRIIVIGVGNLLQKDEGIGIHAVKALQEMQLPDNVIKLFPNHAEHDPSDIAAALAIASDNSVLPLGILYHDPDAPRYDLMSSVGLDMSADEKLAGLNQALDHFAI